MRVTETVNKFDKDIDGLLVILVLYYTSAIDLKNSKHLLATTEAIISNYQGFLEGEVQKRTEHRTKTS